MCISSLPFSNYLIVSDSQASLLSIAKNPFLSNCSSIILRIRTALLALKNMAYTISFLWIPGHVGINGNEYADFLARSIANQSLLGPHTPQVRT